jgi:hypothetical protein
VSALTDLSLNKIGDSTGEKHLCLFWFLELSVAIFSCCLFLLICKLLSPQDTLRHLLGYKTNLDFA